MKSTLYILGAGGFARELQAYISQHISQFEFINLVDDHSPDALSLADYSELVQGWVGGPVYSIMGSGKCEIKRRMLEQIRGDAFTFIHPNADVAFWTTRIGSGCVISSGAVVAPSVWLGDHVLCNYNSTVGHNSVIGDLSVVAPNAAIGGFCTLGKEVYVGAGACIKEGIEIGDRSIIGTGAILLNNVGSDQIVIGNPAKVFPISQWKHIARKLSNLEKQSVFNLIQTHLCKRCDTPLDGTGPLCVNCSDRRKAKRRAT